MYPTFIASSYIDYYGVAFDHIVAAGESNPEVLAINVIEVDNDGGTYANGGTFANQVLQFSIDPTDYTRKRVIAVPRCCQHKKGTQGRARINSVVDEREARSELRCWARASFALYGELITRFPLIIRKRSIT
jgi:hypothetical protein